MVCPHLEYRREADERTFETERAYCGVVESFVQPMRADVCNDRYDLEHDQHCEIYRAHEGLSVVATDHPGSGDPAGPTEQ
jgi:hypothetical protein